MKTTVEISDDILKRLKPQLSARQMTMRAAINEALRSWLELETEKPFEIDPNVGTFHGEGMQTKSRRLDWNEIAGLIYPVPE